MGREEQKFIGMETKNQVRKVNGIHFVEALSTMLSFSGFAR